MCSVLLVKIKNKKKKKKRTKTQKLLRVLVFAEVCKNAYFRVIKFRGQPKFHEIHQS